MEQAYAEETARNAGLPLEAIRDRAAEDIRQILRDGLATEGHRILIVEDEETGDPLGHLWSGPNWRRDPRTLYLWHIFLDEKARGRGIGRELMRRLEKEARSEGRTRIELNVFADNARARDLYASLGYAEMSSQMYKELR